MTIVLTDVDDTLVELVHPWLNKYNKIWNDNLTQDDIHSWNIGSYTKAGKVFYDLLTSDLYDTIEAVEDSLYGIQYIRQNIGRVVFVTSGFGHNGKAKLEALNRLGFNVKPEDFIEATDKSLIRGDYLIDDNYDNCNNFLGVGLLLSRPWNKNNYYRYRVSSWNEIIKYFYEEVVE